MDEVGMSEDSEYDDLESLAMNGKAADKKVMAAKDARRKKRQKIEKLKDLAHIRDWDNRDSLDISMASDTFTNLVKFMKDPMVKEQFPSSKYKAALNKLVDVAVAFDKLESVKEAGILTKV